MGIPSQRPSSAETARFRNGLTLFFVHLLSEPQILFASYPLQILKQLALNFSLRTCADVVNGFDQQVD